MNDMGVDPDKDATPILSPGRSLQTGRNTTQNKCGRWSLASFLEREIRKDLLDIHEQHMIISQLLRTEHQYRAS